MWRTYPPAPPLTARLRLAGSQHGKAGGVPGGLTGVEECTWCGAVVESDDGFRAYEPAGSRRAAFCRLEHVVPWVIQGARWEAGELAEPAGIDSGPLRCSHCDGELGDVHVLLVRHRGEHRIADDFCSVEHLAAWVKAGGRWQ